MEKKIAIVGLGKIGSVIASALLKNKIVRPKQLSGSVRHKDHQHDLAKRLGIKMFHDNAEMVKQADVVILAVKPQAMKNVLKQISNVVTPHHLIITLAAATQTQFIENQLPLKVPVIRAMPNTPCHVNAGVTVLCPGQFIAKPHLEIARNIFSSIGLVEVLDREELMDSVTALSGSGPAYAYIIIESLAEGGVKTGLPRELATTLAAQSMLGGAKMVLETGEHPAKLKDSVTTPAGVTMDGIMELEDGGLRVTLIKAVAKATEKSKEISQSLQLD